MTSVTFTELRNNARRFFDMVEKGEVLEVYRHGKPVAVITPVRPGSMDRWRKARPVDLGGVSLSAAIMAGRRER